MQITGKMTAFVKQVLTKANKTHDGTTTDVDLEIAVKADDAAKKWGTKFATAAFSNFVEAEDEDGVKESQWLQDKIKPARKRFICEKHQVALGDDVLETQPRIVDFTPVDGEPKVIVKVRIPIETTRAQLVGKLTKAVATELKVEFNVAQLAIEFRKGAKASADKRKAEAGKVPSAKDAPAASSEA